MSSKILDLQEDYTVEVQPTQKDEIALYIFRHKSTELGQYTGVTPIKLTPTSTISREIKKRLDPHGKYTPKALGEDLDSIKVILQEYYETQRLSAEKEATLVEENEQKELARNMKIAEDKLKTLDNPVIWMGSIIDWLTAGERNNILLAFISYSSQVILKNPISVIALGEAGSGKTHVEKTGMKLIPQNFIVNEKKITEAALFNRSKSDKYFYDGKIVDYGDMGGNNDMEFADECKNLMKELQSDGYLNKPLSVPDGNGGWVVQDLELCGKPALTYTTVPGYNFDEQEVSRSIFITPRLDNRNVFNAREKMLELNGRTSKLRHEYEVEAEIIPYMVYHLREVLFDVTIINPYIGIIIDFLKDSSYYKRDLPKYNGLLKTITALNYYNHTVYDHDGEKIIYCSLDDVKLFLSLLRPYHESINANISPKAAEVLNDLRLHIDEYVTKEDRETLTDGITTNEYFEFQDLGLSKRSIQRYFGELNNGGFLKVVDSSGRNQNVWNLTGKWNKEDINNLLNLSKEDKERIIFELGEEVMNVINLDKSNPDLDISNHDDNVTVPGWMKFDN